MRLPPFTVTALPARAFELPATSVPLVIKTPPVKLLDALNVVVPEPPCVSEAAPARTSEITPLVRLIAPVTESVLLPVTVPPPRFKALILSETLVRLSTPPLTVTVPLAKAY